MNSPKQKLDDHFESIQKWLRNLPSIGSLEKLGGSLEDTSMSTSRRIIASQENLNKSTAKNSSKNGQESEPRPLAPKKLAGGEPVPLTPKSVLQQAASVSSSTKPNADSSQNISTTKPLHLLSNTLQVNLHPEQITSGSTSSIFPLQHTSCHSLAVSDHTGEGGSVASSHTPPAPFKPSPSQPSKLSTQVNQTPDPPSYLDNIKHVVLQTEESARSSIANTDFSSPSIKKGGGGKKITAKDINNLSLSLSGSASGDDDLAKRLSTGSSISSRDQRRLSTSAADYKRNPSQLSVSSSSNKHMRRSSLGQRIQSAESGNRQTQSNSDVDMKHSMNDDKLGSDSSSLEQILVLSDKGSWADSLHNGYHETENTESANGHSHNTLPYNGSDSSLLVTPQTPSRSRRASAINNGETVANTKLNTLSTTSSTAKSGLKSLSPTASASAGGGGGGAGTTFLSPTGPADIPDSSSSSEDVSILQNALLLKIKRGSIDLRNDRLARQSESSSNGGGGIRRLSGYSSDQDQESYSVQDSHQSKSMTSMDDSGSLRDSISENMRTSNTSTSSRIHQSSSTNGEKKRITAAMLNLLKGGDNLPDKVRVSVSDSVSMTSGSNNNSQERLQFRNSELSLEIPRTNSGSAAASSLALNDLRKEFLSGPILLTSAVKPGEHQPPPGHKPRSPLKSILKVEPSSSSSNSKIALSGTMATPSGGMGHSNDSLDEHGQFSSRTKVKWDKTRVHTFEPMEDESKDASAGPSSKNKKRDLMRV
ncbi:hypothetical protein BDR26DRAFT_858613 [Obelidium mucronatum]|nr:hypothetical protein BDR26DRAFT_858613 [Obelidium mucronatum]